jgi:hypothetical protein
MKRWLLASVGGWACLEPTNSHFKMDGRYPTLGSDPLHRV